ncbi:LacI family DNA-binding transcriptional regulator [Chryseolinea sp. H1M3-3]|uniref:LacI family DNA-binding transcriptional regulator n=1 Tax=Chryseolinea sp. H1M3-3 TaxID=3034144 RepID=UPI0023EC9400|nr:LacI family DNA-binding transcriptional regulator [Chryseolinea sp. H1M3-3]
MNNSKGKVKKKATIVDIALKLGITPSAVSKAFSNHPRISEQTKEAVLKAAQQLDYRPNAMATGLRKGKSGLIGVIVPAIHYSFFATAIKGAEETLSREGYSVIIAQSKDDYNFEKKQLEGMMRAQVEGVIASLAMGTQNFDFYKILSSKIPVVLFDRTFEDEKISTVTVDDFSGAVKAIDHLVQRGYSRIAHLAGYSHVLPFRKRIDGYKRALIDHGIIFDPDYLIECAPNTNEGINATESLFKLSQPPDAIFAASDYLAFGAISVVQEKGIKIPEEFGIVGFSNEQFSSQVTPAISTVDQFSETLGSTAAQLLIDQLRDGKVKNFIPQRKVISPQLIHRQSSAGKIYYSTPAAATIL